MRSSSECPVFSLSADEVAILSARDLCRLLTGLRLAYSDLSLDPTFPASLWRLPRVLELRPSDLDLRRLPRLEDTWSAGDTQHHKQARHDQSHATYTHHTAEYILRDMKIGKRWKRRSTDVKPRKRNMKTSIQAMTLNRPKHDVKYARLNSY